MTTPAAPQGALPDLDVLVGTWHLTASLAEPGMEPSAETTFEWMEGRRFLIQRWHVDHPDAPDGIAIIGQGDRGGYRQYYFDSRGVVRQYEMTLSDRVWTLIRIEPGFSQRFSGRIDESGNEIAGAWEASGDEGTTWQNDFDLTYRRAVG